MSTPVSATVHHDAVGCVGEKKRQRTLKPDVEAFDRILARAKPSENGFGKVNVTFDSAMVEVLMPKGEAVPSKPREHKHREHREHRHQKSHRHKDGSEKEHKAKRSKKEKENKPTVSVEKSDVTVISDDEEAPEEVAIPEPIEVAPLVVDDEDDEMHPRQTVLRTYTMLNVHTSYMRRWIHSGTTPYNPEGLKASVEAVPFKPEREIGQRYSAVRNLYMFTDCVDEKSPYMRVFMDVMQQYMQAVLLLYATNAQRARKAHDSCMDLCEGRMIAHKIGEAHFAWESLFTQYVDQVRDTMAEERYQSQTMLNSATALHFSCHLLTKFARSDKLFTMPNVTCTLLLRQREAETSEEQPSSLPPWHMCVAPNDHVLKFNSANQLALFL
jgi:hypothetical protein